jgi:hypothetical protein
MRPAAEHQEIEYSVLASSSADEMTHLRVKFRSIRRV